MSNSHSRLQWEILQCRKCPRLALYREQVARQRRRSYRHCRYWGRPVPSLGPISARLVLIGLAPGAHGANRTGRMFTGDSSGNFLYAALYRNGLCNQPQSRRRDDGLCLHDTYISSALHCVPPQNRPSASELETCRHFLTRELKLLGKARVILALGGVAWLSYLRARLDLGWDVPRPRPRFGHGAVACFEAGPPLLGTYHPSRQNTQTGRLTAAMFDAVLQQALAIIGG